MAQQVKTLPLMQEIQETGVQFLCWEYPLEEGMETHSSILAGNILWIKSLVSCSSWVHKELDVSEVSEQIRR